MSVDAIKLGYLMVYSPSPNIFVGGAMVTDGRGLPLEFRYTEPIQPTRIQQILYGQVLSQYIKRDVIFQTLLKSLESPFDCLIVEDEQLLEIAPEGKKLVRLQETKSAAIGEVGTLQVINEREFLLQSAPQGNPVRLLLPKISKEAGAEGDPKLDKSKGEAVCLPKGYESLSSAGFHMDVTEPLKRIAKALETLCQESAVGAS